MKTRISSFIFSFFALAILLVSCHKKNDTASPAVQTGNLSFHIHSYIDSVEIEEDQLIEMTLGSQSGRQIKVSHANLLISNIQLVKADGSMYTISNTLLHPTIGEEIYPVAAVPIGNYQSVSFDIGLDTSLNATVPTSNNSILYDSSVWFGSSASSVPSTGGYVFLHFEGTIDTSSAMDGSQFVPFEYKIGTTANLKTINLPSTEPFTITTNGTQYVHMVFNYAALLNGIALHNSRNLYVLSPSDNKLPFVTTMLGNVKAGGYQQLQNFVSYEE